MTLSGRPGATPSPNFDAKLLAQLAAARNNAGVGQQGVQGTQKQANLPGFQMAGGNVAVPDFSGNIGLHAVATPTVQPRRSDSDIKSGMSRLARVTFNPDKDFPEIESLREDPALLAALKERNLLSEKEVTALTA